MATGDLVGEVGNQLVNRVLGSIIYVIIALVVIGLIGGLVWYRVAYRKKFDIKIFIKSERAGERRAILEDWGAILLDRKTNTKFLRLLDLRVDLPVPPYNAMQKTDKGDLIEIWRKSEDEFIYLLPSTINKTHFIRQDGTVYTLADREQKQLEGDIAYWNVKRKEKNKNMFSQDSMFMKILPFIPQILGGVITIFILYVLMDKLPNILGQMTELAKQMKQACVAQAVPV